MEEFGKDDLFPQEIPPKHQKYVDRFRTFINDTPQANDLLGKEESTDLELYYSILDTWDDINTSVPPASLHYEALELVPSWTVLKLGTLLNVLISRGIVSARNNLSYQDSGGVSIKVDDEYGRYTVFFNMLVNKYRRKAINMKRETNINNCYGGVESPYYDLPG